VSTIPERVLRIEAASLLAAADRLDEAAYEAAEDILARTSNPIIVTGVGTSGALARKIAATLTSTGSRAVFLHPSDALHGQLGIVEPEDVVIAVSNSGETEELLATLPYLRSRKAKIIAIVGSTQSTLARAAHVALDARAEAEACPLNLAPTSSTTLALAVGDALAVALMTRKGVTAEGFARNHPSGQLGRRLTLSVSDLMLPADVIPRISPGTKLLDVLAAITHGGAGAALVTKDRSLLGLVTDGDVRRGLAAGGERPLNDIRAEHLMTRTPETATPDMPAYDALCVMEDRPSQISVLPVVDRAGAIVGLIRLHDLVKSGL
jgi:arabinose-5-phosphate isomerase